MVATIDHCLYCFDTLNNRLSNNENNNTVIPNFENDEYPLFVTWKKNENGQKRLRGCIGNFKPLSLHTGLKQYALLSAFKDPRFSPIASHEIPDLICSVSLLVNFEDAEDYNDWQVGKHGIQIYFTDPKKNSNHSATFLPEVALEQGWDQERTLLALIKKSGYMGTVNDSFLESIRLVRYQSSKAVAEFPDYLALKASLVNQS